MAQKDRFSSPACDATDMQVYKTLRNGTKHRMTSISFSMQQQQHVGCGQIEMDIDLTAPVRA
jgi:hypothetical protein